MGSGQSARKLTIDNEEIGVIGISDSVVKRIAMQRKQKDSGESSKVRSALSDSSSKNVVPPPISSTGDMPVNSGYPIYYPQLTLTALKVQQEKEQELRNQDNYWQRRLQNLEQRHSKINEILETEYKKAAEELYSVGKENVNVQNTVQPCKNSSEKVLKCYQDHPKQILKCSPLVEEFSNCVDMRRARVIAARC